MREVIPFPTPRARPAMTPAQRRVHLANVATPAQANPWRDYGELLLTEMKGGVA